MELSFGQRQRVAITRTIGRKHSLVFSIESAVNLDTRLGLVDIQKDGQINRLLHRASTEPKIAEMSDRVIQAQDGLILMSELGCRH